jgi:hypothetical protein
MWVFTQDGFVSAVDNKQVEGKLTVRARDRLSLETLADMAETEIIESPPHRDYEYRVFVTREQFAEWMRLNVEFLDYSNFKNRVWETRGDVYHDACSDVWDAMLAVSDLRDPVG